MDPFDPGADLPPVTLALTRHPATGTRLGTLVMNPGGPGGSGLDAAWGIRSAMPADILRAYDIVSWDPRGIGASTPPIDCGDDPDLESPEFMADCAQHTGELAAYLSGPYSAADLEAIRVALGEERLDYLGYSYGTIIGATFAADHPDQVGHFVLDGRPIRSSVGPTAPPTAASRTTPTTASTPRSTGSSSCAIRATRARWATTPVRRSTSCVPLPRGCRPTTSPASRTWWTTRRSTASSSAPSTFAGDWPLLATALGDARDGDASALAGLAADDPTLPPADAEAESSPGPSFEVANLVIYCADFAAEIEGSGFCDPLPRNEHTIEPIRPVDVERPILVIGTEFDPLTPGYHAAEFADALG